MNREDLEAIAKKTVSSELYYDLCDNLDVTTDDELLDIIACKGDYKKEFMTYALKKLGVRYD